MATIISHSAVALGLAPWLRTDHDLKVIVFTGMLLTVLPDIDVFGFWLGIPYEHLLGHRGLTHSLFFAAVFSAGVAWLLSQRLHMHALSIWLYLFLCMASHGFIDAMTNGGLGIAFLAPFHNERFFFPFQPIEVSTLNIVRFFQGQGLSVIKSEVIWVLLPCFGLFILGYCWKKTKNNNT